MVYRQEIVFSVSSSSSSGSEAAALHWQYARYATREGSSDLQPFGTSVRCVQAALYIKRVWFEDHIGDIVHLEVFNQHIIILNSMKAVNDLLEQRSTIYSSRPAAVMTSEL